MTFERRSFWGVPTVCIVDMVQDYLWQRWVEMSRQLQTSSTYLGITKRILVDFCSDLEYFDPPDAEMFILVPRNSGYTDNAVLQVENAVVSGLPFSELMSNKDSSSINTPTPQQKNKLGQSVCGFEIRVKKLPPTPADDGYFWNSRFAQVQFTVYYQIYLNH